MGEQSFVFIFIKIKFAISITQRIIERQIPNDTWFHVSILVNLFCALIIFCKYACGFIPWVFVFRIFAQRTIINQALFFSFVFFFIIIIFTAKQLTEGILIDGVGKRCASAIETPKSFSIQHPQLINMHGATALIHFVNIRVPRCIETQCVRFG